MKFWVLVLCLLVAGCAGYRARAEFHRMCRSPGHEMDTRCARRVPRPPEDLVLFCERRGGVRDCWYVRREELMRAVQDVLGPQ